MKTYKTQANFTSSFVYLLVASVAFLVFLPWGQGYFLGDDWMLYARNSGRPLPDQLQMISDASCSSQYRPLSELSLGWIWSLFGFNPVGHHIVSFAIHALDSVLVAGLGQRLARDRRVGLWAGLSFAVLGCHTEAVVWMTARHEMLAAAFALLGMISYIVFKDGGKRIWWIGAFLFYVVSLGFKETTLALPILLCFYDLIFVMPESTVQWRSSLGRLIPLLPPLVVGTTYALYRIEVGGAYDLPFTLLGPPKNLIYYLLMETVALPASMDFLPRFPLATLPVIALLAVMCALSVWLAKDRIMRNRVVWFGALWMVVALAPVIRMVAERTTYFSSVGWALAIAAIVTITWDAGTHNNVKRWLIVLVVVTILGANLVALTHRGYWRDQAADVSYDMFSRVKARMLALPPEKGGQLWFIDIPNHIEYADVFGNRILFAVWLLEEQLGAPHVEVLHIQKRNVSSNRVLEQLLLERAVEGPIFVFYWQDGEVVELSLPEGVLSP